MGNGFKFLTLLRDSQTMHQNYHFMLPYNLTHPISFYGVFLSSTKGTILSLYGLKQFDVDFIFVNDK